MLDKFLKNNMSEFNNFIEKYNIDLVVIFGSYALGTEKKESDLDIAIRSSNKDLQDFKIELINELSDIFNKDVDLVILNNKTDLLLKYEIVRIGKVIFEKEQYLFAEFKSLIIRMYLCQSYLIKRCQEEILRRKLREIKSVT